MPVDLRPPKVLVELNGADPVHVATNSDVSVIILDWDEVRAGATDSQELVGIHDFIEKFSPNTARSIRDVLRERGKILPPEYNSDFDKE